MMDREEPLADDRAEVDAVAAAQADPSRFAALYERNFETVYAYVARRASSRAEAEDVTSTVFHNALANIGRFEWRGVPFVAWLLRIAANELADQRAQPTTPLSDEVGVDSAELEAIEWRADLSRRVRDLPGDQRRVISLRFAEGRSIREVAEALGRSEGAVKQLQVRALRTLRTQLGGVHV